MEKFASDSLKALGATVYYPRYTRETKHARKISRVDAPVFPGYLFVLNDGAVPFRYLNSARGVSGFLRCETNGDPAKVPDDVVAALKSREIGGLIEVATVESAFGFKPGQELKIGRTADSAFIGLISKFSKMVKHDLAEVQISLFGRVTPMRINVRHLEIV